MPTEEELAVKRRRRGYWLRLARGGKSQAGIAELLGLSPKSASTVSDWERGEADPSLRQLEELAAYYRVPLALFIEPPRTDEERLDELSRGGGEIEREDWEAGEGDDQTSSDGNGVEPGTPP